MCRFRNLVFSLLLRLQKFHVGRAECGGDCQMQIMLQTSMHLQQCEPRQPGAERTEKDHQNVRICLWVFNHP